MTKQFWHKQLPSYWENSSSPAPRSLQHLIQSHTLWGNLSPAYSIQYSISNYHNLRATGQAGYWKWVSRSNKNLIKLLKSLSWSRGSVMQVLPWRQEPISFQLICRESKVQAEPGLPKWLFMSSLESAYFLDELRPLLVGAEVTNNTFQGPRTVVWWETR